LPFKGGGRGSRRALADAHDAAVRADGCIVDLDDGLMAARSSNRLSIRDPWETTPVSAEVSASW
jgi:hypothetical protein